MPNEIPTRQNEPRFQTLLAAFSQSYDNVAFYGSIQATVIVATAVLVPLFGLVHKDLKPWGGALSVVMLIVGFALEFIIQHYQHLGAKIQEVFDTELFGLRWNGVKSGEKPTDESVRELAQAFHEKHSNDQPRLNRLRDWYPTDVGVLPLSLARIVCQRSSMSWDASLRKKYRWVYVGIAVLLFIAGLVYALGKEMEIGDVILTIALPLLPSCIKLTQKFWQQTESAGKSEKVRQHLIQTWSRAMSNELSEDELATESRDLQDELLSRRFNSSQIPKRFYLRYRNRDEERMVATAQDMVVEAQSILEPSPDKAL